MKKGGREKKMEKEIDCLCMGLLGVSKRQVRSGEKEQYLYYGGNFRTGD
jgi:hypothetical protein